MIIIIIMYSTDKTALYKRIDSDIAALGCKYDVLEAEQKPNLSPPRANTTMFGQVLSQWL